MCVRQTACDKDLEVGDGRTTSQKQGELPQDESGASGFRTPSCLPQAWTEARHPVYTGAGGPVPGRAAGPEGTELSPSRTGLGAGRALTWLRAWGNDGHPAWQGLGAVGPACREQGWASGGRAQWEGKERPTQETRAKEWGPPGERRRLRVRGSLVQTPQSAQARDASTVTAHR